MNSFLLDELLMEERLRAYEQRFERLDPRTIACAASRDGGVRRSVASLLVRLGMMLDGAAGERAAVARGVAIEGPRR